MAAVIVCALIVVAHIPASDGRGDLSLNSPLEPPTSMTNEAISVAVAGDSSSGEGRDGVESPAAPDTAKIEAPDSEADGSHIYGRIVT